MPLYVNGENISKFSQLNNCFENGDNNFEQLKVAGCILKTKSKKIVGSHDLALYVAQKEYATVKPGEGHLQIIGTDESSTCHILIFRHTGSGVVSVGHFDGSSTSKGIFEMFESVEQRSLGSPEGRFELHLIGGFLDERHLSLKLIKEIINSIISLNKEIHLVTYVVLGGNDTILNGIHFPILTGIGVDVLSGELFPAEFTHKGPDCDIRSAAGFASSKSHMINIYKNGLLEFGPYFWNEDNHFYPYIEASDEFIRKNFSTSPKQESKYFVDHIRSSFKVLFEHPDSAATLFKDGRPRFYEMDENSGSWRRICF